MTIPESAKADALSRVAVFCDRRVPPELRGEIRLEHSVRGNRLTISERRPPWRSDFGPEWTSLQVAQIRYDESSGMWSLHSRDARDRWHLYTGRSACRSVEPLLAEIDANPTGIFFG